MDAEKRAEERRRRIVAHRAESFEDAEYWDLLFWQSQSPEARLSALVALRQDVDKVLKARETAEKEEE